MRNKIFNNSFCQTIYTLILIIVFSGNTFSNNVNKSQIMTSPFNQLIVKGNINVYIIQGTEQKIIFEGSNNSVKQIKETVSNNTLSLSTENSSSNERINVYLTIVNLESIKTTGEVEIETPTIIDLSKLSLNLSEKTKASLFINSNLLDLSVSGSGWLDLSGNIVTLKLTGTEKAKITGKINSNKLLCRSFQFCNIEIKGTVYKSFLSISNKSSIDLTACKNYKNEIVSPDIIYSSF